MTQAEDRINCKYLTSWLCCMKRTDDDPICIEVEGIECKDKETEDVSR